jgi:hypothetical protein
MHVDPEDQAEKPLVARGVELLRSSFRVGSSPESS